nr:synaptogenesis protein syg-2-like [Lytechinus pictus]
MSDAHSGRQYLNNANISITAGESFSITCGANRARPPAVLHWLVPEDVTVVHQDQSDIIQDGSYISRKTLTITPTRVDHEKSLSCIASHPEIQKSLRSSVLLNVHVLPSSVLLFPTGGNQSQSTVIYVQEDSPTSITCKSIGSFPATELSFWLVGDFDRTPIHANVSSNRSVLDDTLFDTESTITIRPGATNHGMHIVCSSYMDDAYFFKILTVSLIVYGLPDEVAMTVPGDMLEGRETNVTCRARNRYPTPLIHWYIGSRNVTGNSSLKTSFSSAARYDAESTLIFIANRIDHGKRLLCSHSTVSTPTISFQPRQSLPVKGEDFTMKCIYSPPSNVRSLHWRHEGIQVAYESCTSMSSCTTSVPNPTNYKILGDDHSTSLTIINLTTGDNGRYTCGVFNLDGQRSANEQLEALNPVPPARVFVSDTQSGWQYLNYANISITAGDPYNITCGVNRARPPAVLQWLIPEDVTVVNQDQSDDIQDGYYTSRKSLTITPTRNDHGKIISCVVSHQDLQRTIRYLVTLNVHVLPTSVLLFLTGGNQSQSTVLYVQEDSPTSITWLQDEVVMIVPGDMLEGRETNVTCRARNRYPAPLLNWYIGSRNVTNSSSLKISVNSAE